ncbi:hypothetical protein ACP4OV_013972 [Aristida adscensionis]
MAAVSKLAAAAGSGGRHGWADLPRDLLESVLARLPVADRLRFPAVCTAWQSAAAESAGGGGVALVQGVESPWLMLPFNPTRRGGEGDGTSSEARFLSLADGRAYAVRQPPPAAADRLCVGSSDGWLVAADAASELQLLNPLTGAQVPLPSVTTLPFVDAARDADGRVVSYRLRCFCVPDGGGGGADEVLAMPPETLAPDRLRYELYEKAILVSPPRRATTGSWGGYAVLLICQPLLRLAVARAGDTSWTLLDTPSRCWVDAVRAASYSAPAAADGAQRRAVVYTLDTTGRVETWDMDAATTDATATPTPTPTPHRTIAPACCCCSARACAMSAACSRYLVELSPGRLLQVHRLRRAAHALYKDNWEPRPERVEYTTAEVELFELMPGAAVTGGGVGRWAPVDGEDAGGGLLAGRALFLGKSASLCVPAPADGGERLRGGCVYFTDDAPWSHERCREVAPDVGVLDLADGSYRPPRGAARDLLWKWPPPVWVFPSLAD